MDKKKPSEELARSSQKADSLPSDKTSSKDGELEGGTPTVSDGDVSKEPVKAKEPVKPTPSAETVAVKNSKPEAVESDEGSSEKEKLALSDKPEKEEVTKGVEFNKSDKEPICLSGVFAFKLAMSSLYDENGHWTPVTFLEFRPWFVSQVKRKDQEGYNSVQLACMPQKNKRCARGLIQHLSPAGFSQGARYVREIRQDSVDSVEVGQELSIQSLKKGDRVRVSAVSKGHGFTGVVKRWGFSGGRASHGSKNHRTSGSIGNRTEPARVMPGKKMAGHYGAEQISVKNVRVVDVIKDENLIVLKGPVPGARNSLVYLALQKRGKA